MSKKLSVQIGNTRVGEVRRTSTGVECIEWPIGNKPEIVRDKDGRISEVRHTMTEAEVRAWTTAILGVLE